MGLPASRSEKGLTVIEVLLAMTISFIAFLGLTEAILVAVDFNTRNALRDEAVSVAENQLNEDRNLHFDNVVTAALPSQPRRIRLRNVSYGLSRAVEAVDADTKQVTVAVSWTQGNPPVPMTQTYTTIVRRR